jgi:hypothetical protein
VWTSNYYPRFADPDRVRVLNKKFMQTLDADIYNTLNIVAKENGIPVEELLRAVVVPDWMEIVSANAPKRSTRLENNSRENAEKN